MGKLAGLTAGIVLCASSALTQQQVAILDSANTREFFSRHYNGCPGYLPSGEEYMRYFKGWQYALNQSPAIPFTTIHDADITRETLAKFKVLVLSNNASLTEGQAQTIHQWVVRGGRLLATFGSGYKSTELDLREDDQLRRQKGHTFGLHELWHDPMTRVFSSFNIGSGVDVRISRFAGPTGCPDLQSALASTNGVLPYGAEANILTQRPDKHPDVLAYVQFQGSADWNRPTPAILATEAGQGRVVYYAFAPEFIVALAWVPEAVNPSCRHDPNVFADRAEEALLLMRCTVNWLLGP